MAMPKCKPPRNIQKPVLLVILFCSFPIQYSNFLKCRFANEATIYLGAVNMAYKPSKLVVEPQRVVIDSRPILHHPDYNPAEMVASLPTDLALIKLPFPIEFNGTKL